MRRRVLVPTLAALIGLAPALAAAASAPHQRSAAAPRDPRALRETERTAARAVRSWAFAIGSGDLRGDVARRYAGYRLVVTI